jgi:hypothetical protein
MSEIADTTVLQFYKYVEKAQHDDGLKTEDVMMLTAIT